MNYSYLYEIEDGQFSFQFTAPLLGNIGDKIKLYDSIERAGKLEIFILNEIKILDITRYDKMDEKGNIGYVECSGYIAD